MKIEEARSEIDAIDAQIVQLLNRRAKIAKCIGAVKARTGMPVFDRRREAEVMRSVNHVSEGVFGQAAIERIFNEILLESRRLQRVVPVQRRQPEQSL